MILDMTTKYYTCFDFAKAPRPHTTQLNMYYNSKRFKLTLQIRYLIATPCTLSSLFSENFVRKNMFRLQSKVINQYLYLNTQFVNERI